MVLVKHWSFFNLLFKGNIGQENVFYDILEQKNPFLGYKKKSLKSGKIAIDPNGLVHGFGKKLAIFPSFFFGNIGQENVFYHIIEQKNVFLSYKNKKFKPWKNCYFSKGVSPWFWSKIGHFSIFYLKAI